MDQSWLIECSATLTFFPLFAFVVGTAYIWLSLSQALDFRIAILIKVE